MTDKENNQGPAHAGKFNGYMPEYRVKEAGEEWNSWKSVPTDIIPSEIGVPYPSFQKHILESLGFYGFAQAKTLAWWFLAHIKSKFIAASFEARVQKYEIVYDLKSNKSGEPETEKCDIFE